jgi:hypothetical protein
MDTKTAAVKLNAWQRCANEACSGNVVSPGCEDVDPRHLAELGELCRSRWKRVMELEKEYDERVTMTAKGRAAVGQLREAEDRAESARAVSKAMERKFARLSAWLAEHRAGPVDGESAVDTAIRLLASKVGP